MQEKIQNVLQRNSFRAQMICIGVVIIIANTAFMFHEQMGKKSCTRLGVDKVKPKGWFKNFL